MTYYHHASSSLACSQSRTRGIIAIAPAPLWPSWDGGGRQMSKPNPVTGEQAWKHPLLQQMGGEPAHGSQCSECHCCYCGIQEGPELCWAHVANRPSSKKDVAHAHTWPHMHLSVCQSLCHASSNPAHICGLCPFLFITLSPPEHPGERKIACQQNTLAFTNSILNVEVPTEGKISGSLKMRVKTETFLHLPMKLNWCGLMYHGIYRRLSCVLKRDVDFSDQKVKSFYYQTSTNGGYFLHFPFKAFRFAAPESLYLAQLSLCIWEVKLFLHFWKVLSQATVMVNEMLNLSSGKIALISWD